MKTTTKALLIIAVIVPVVLLFWPFAHWNGVMAVVLRVVPSFAAQVLLFENVRRNIIRMLPAALMGLLAVWGTYLFFTSPHWGSATVGDLIADYVSPFTSCVIALLACLVVKKCHICHPEARK